MRPKRTYFQSTLTLQNSNHRELAPPRLDPLISTLSVLSFFDPRAKAIFFYDLQRHFDFSSAINNRLSTN
jgi:hypothetical protein